MGSLPGRKLLLLIPVLALIALLVWRPLSREGATVAPAAAQPEPAPASVTAELARPSPGVPTTGSSRDREPVVEAGPPAPSATPPSTEAWLDVTVQRAAGGAPVAGARVWLPGPDQEATARTTSAAGRVQLSVPPGARLTCAVVEGLFPAGEELPILVDVGPIAAGERCERVVELTPFFHGRLVAAESGAPIAGARVGSNDPAAGEMLSAADGSFRLRSGPLQGKRVARVEARGFAPARVAPVEGFEDPELPYVLRLARAATLEPTIVGADGAPVEGATVALSVQALALMHPPGRFAGGSWKAEAQSAGDGRCRLEGLPPEVTIEVTVRKSGVRVESLVLQPGELAQPVWRVGGQAVVRGILLDEERAPVPDQELWLCRATTDDETQYLSAHMQALARGRTDAQGRFEMRAAPAGAAWIGPAPGGALCPHAVRVDVAPDRELDLELHTWRGLAISGRVLASDGLPLARGRVSCRLLAGAGAVFADVQDGVFSVGPLAPGDHRLVASGSQEGSSVPVEARAGDSGLVLRLAATGAVRVRVVDAGRDSSVEVFERARPGPPRLTSRGSGATHHLTGLPTGLLDLVARTADGRIGLAPGVRMDAVDMPSIEIPVARGAQLVVRYQGGPASADLRVFQGASQVAFVRLPRGTAGVEVVPASALRIELASAGHVLAERALHPVPDRPYDVVFDLD